MHTDPTDLDDASARLALWWEDATPDERSRLLFALPLAEVLLSAWRAASSSERAALLLGVRPAEFDDAVKLYRAARPGGRPPFASIGAGNN